MALPALPALPDLPALADMAHAIQLAVAPVFLLTGIAGLLAVMTGRLARIIDRGRWFEQHWAGLDEGARGAAWRELAELEHRRRLASRAITACTFAALAVCCVVAALFVEALAGLPLKVPAGVLFIVSMGALIGGLGAFLREVRLATETVRIAMPGAAPVAAPDAVPGAVPGAGPGAAAGTAAPRASRAG